MSEIFGHKIEDLPEGWIATGILVLVKCFATDAGLDDIPVRLSIRGSEDLSIIDCLGMIEAAKIDVSEQFRESMGDG